MCTATVGLDQWSRGEYAGASNTEDDMAIITSKVGPRVSTESEPAACTATLPYRDLSTVAASITISYPTATITCGGGSHSYPMRIRGRYNITVMPPDEGNMKFQVTISRAVQSGGVWIASGSTTVLGSNDAYASTPVRFRASAPVVVNDYLITVRSIAEPGNSNTYAFPEYGSVGSYTLSIRNGF